MAQYAPFGAYAFGVIPPEYSGAVSDPFSALALDPDLELQYLIEFYPYDPDLKSQRNQLPAPIGGVAFGQINVGLTGGINTVCFSDQRFVTEPDDSLPNKYFMPVVNNPLQFDISIRRGDTLGDGAVSFGAIEIENGDGCNDHLSKMQWKGRRAVVKAGHKGWRYDLFVPVFSGLVNTLEYTDKMITVTFRDNSLRLDLDVVSAEYAGTGGLEGGSDLAGKLKPLLFGECLNIEPTLVDPVNLIYQIHAGSIEAVDAVFDSAAELTSSGDVADITTATPSAGHYVTQLDAGLIRVGSTPLGRITVDARGDNTGGYVSTVGDITKRIVKTLIGTQSLDDGDIDQTSFALINTELSGAAGVYITEKQTIRNIIDTLIPKCGAFWFFDRVGLLSCAVINVPTSPEATITHDFIDTSGISTSGTIPAAWRVSVSYARAWAIQGEDEIAGAATTSRRAFVTHEYRLSTFENQDTKNLDPHASEFIFYSPFVDKADADTLAARLYSLYGQDREVYSVTVYGALFRNYLGSAVRLVYPRYGIDSNFLIAGLSENAERGQTVMELWG